MHFTNHIPQLSVDCVIFGYEKAEIKVLVTEFKVGVGLFGLPGGFVLQSENIGLAAKRILMERTGLDNIFLEQYYTFGAADRRNPAAEEIAKKIVNDDSLPQFIDWISKRFVSVGYYALVDIAKVQPKPGLFDKSAIWYRLDSLPAMIMDHNSMVQVALESLRANLDQKLIAFNLLPATFTMRELQELYEAVYGRAFPRNNFQKKILALDILERLEKKYTGAANKAPFLYKRKNL